MPFMLRGGGGGGVGALLKGISVVASTVESAVFTPTPTQSLPDRDSNSQPLDYESDSLTIRPHPLHKCN